MKLPLTGLLLMFGIASAVAMIFVVVQLGKPPSAPVAQNIEDPDQPSVESLAPSLDCAFHDFMRTRAVVSFYFDVVRVAGNNPVFYERAVITGDGKRTNFEGQKRPSWRYSLDEDGKPNLISPDETTRIVLYGLRLGTPGVLPVEAGIRSNQYRNLGGECRQTNLG